MEQRDDLGKKTFSTMIYLNGNKQNKPRGKSAGIKSKLPPLGKKKKEEEEIIIPVRINSNKL